MNQMYHYATVSKALDELNENGFTYDFNLHEQDIAKNPQKYEIKHIYYEGNTDPGDSSRLWYPIQIREKGSSSHFAANSISDAAQVLLISVLKTE
jgi:hypothetical protein